ncbi:MAG TPA: CoA pyrophosphatase [Syntrophales bacterium]|nr:CoA pyrophosphatase [Syntrophales bacterium]
MSTVNTETLSNREQFLSLVVEKLGKAPIDFKEKLDFINKSKSAAEPHSAAGVLLLIHHNGDEFIFQLIKRSARVAQPGDLSCPGGLLHNIIDPLLTPLLSTGIIPVMGGEPLRYARARDSETFRIIKLFLANAIRESWEETGLSPWNIDFLGPLTTYSLLLFRRTILPLVGFAKKRWDFCPNLEVESIVEIPLAAFLDESSYAIYNVETASEVRTARQRPNGFPCLIARDRAGKEEILWGATFYIIMNFMKMVFNLDTPYPGSNRVINRKLGPDYLTGHPDRY